MSEMHTVKVIFKDENILIQSLEEIGYKTQVCDNGLSIDGGKTAHVVVRKDQFVGMRDVGFERTSTGFVMHADDYDVGRYGKRFNIKSLNKTYVENTIKKYVGTTSSCNIFSRQEKENGQIEIQLKIT